MLELSTTISYLLLFIINLVLTFKKFKIMDKILKRKISRFLERESFLIKKFTPRLMILEVLVSWFTDIEGWIVIVLSLISALVLFMIANALHNGSRDLRD